MGLKITKIKKGQIVDTEPIQLNICKEGVKKLKAPQNLNPKGDNIMTSMQNYINYGRRVSGNVENCLEQAGLDYEVALTGACFNPVEQGIELHNVPQRFVTYRTDTKQAFGVVGSRYTIIQNKVMFDFLDFSEGFELTNGSPSSSGGWLCGRFAEEEVHGETFIPYVFLGNTFDGTKQFCVSFAPYRVSKGNFVNLAGAVYRLDVRHTKSSPHKLDLGRVFVKQTAEAMKGFRGVVDATIGKQVTTEKAKEIFAHILTFGRAIDKNKPLEEQLPRHYNEDLACLLDNFHGENSKYTYTGYAVLLAVSTFVEQVLKGRVRSEEAYIQKSVFATNPLLAEAYKKVMEI